MEDANNDQNFNTGINSSSIPPEAIVGDGSSETPLIPNESAPAASSPKEKSSQTGLIIALSVIVILLLVGGIFGYFYLTNKINDLTKNQSSSLVEDEKKDSTSTISKKTEAETAEIESEIAKLDETIKETENSSDPDDQKANIEAKLKKLQYELDLEDPDLDDLNKALSLIDELEESISKLPESAQGDLDVSNLKTLIETMKMLKTYTETGDTSVDWYQDLMNMYNEAENK